MRLRCFAGLLLAWLSFAGLIFDSTGQIVISEFMAENDGFFRDQDGDTPDWIELHNTSPSTVNLAGWHLTDDSNFLAKWSFPATNLAGRSFLIVFASGKDRAIGGAELHANFQLDSAGEYLALIAPDGTVAHAFAPAFPAQRANVAYGVGRVVTTIPLVLTGATARVHVPADGSLAQAWTAPPFNDSNWMSGPTGIGFERGSSPGPNGTPVLSIDFNDDDMGEVGAANTETGFSTMTLSSNPSTFNGISVTISSLGGATLDDRDRAQPVDAPPNFTMDQLYDDFIFAVGQTNGNGLRLRLTGLVPDQDYYVTIWSYDNSSTGSRVSDWVETASGTTKVILSGYSFDGAVLPSHNAQHTVKGQVRASSAGVLQIEGRRSGGTSHGVFLNALQLAPVSYRSLLATDIGTAMSNQNASAFIRIPFQVGDPAAIQTLQFAIKYDDGFFAYLNGQLIASRNAPPSAEWHSTATLAHPKTEAIVFEEITIPDASELLLNGANVLAIHGLNVATNDPDFLILPELRGINAVEQSNRYLAAPTPGGLNSQGYAGFVEDTRFSVDRGFYDSPFFVEITTVTAGAEIRFTRDGSAPSPTNGIVYGGPIQVTNTTILRAAAFLPGLIPTDVDTHTYIFLDQVLRQPVAPAGYPTVWPDDSYPADYAMDPTVVNHTNYGLTIKSDMRAVPTLSIVTDFNSLWNTATGIYVNAGARGPDWERSTSAELILPEGTNGSTAFAVNCGIRMQGNASRDNLRTPKHSMRLLFKSDYGPSKLNYDWFPGDVERFDNIALLARGFVDAWATRYSDSTPIGSTGYVGQRYRPETAIYLRDVWFRSSMRDMGWLGTRSAFVHLYLNGLYWGIYNPTERVDASFVASHLGGRDLDWDVLVGGDTSNVAEAADGTLDDWRQMMSIVNAGITNETAYQAVASLVDIDNLIDYMILHIFAEAEDWPHHNWYAAHRHANSTNGLPATKWIFIAWDQEVALDRLVRRNRIDVGTAANQLDSPARIYAQLRAHPEFRRMFGDRVHKHLFNDGALTPTNNIARLQRHAAEIDRAIVGESARWGDAREFATPQNAATGKTFTRDEWWAPELRQFYTNFFPNLNATNIARFRAGLLYPNVGAPTFSQFGGLVEAGFGLDISHTNATGTIFYTLDGSDPRIYETGAVSSAAQAYSEPIVINSTTQVRARVLSGSQWSALVDTVFFPPQDLSGLALTEIMYNPPAIGALDGDEFEFIELKNTGTNTLNLSGLNLSGINFTFTNGTIMGPGQFFVLTRNASGFASKYPGVVINGVYSGRLDNGGERLTLRHLLGAGVFSVEYDDTAPWPVAADNYGFSIVPKEAGLSQAPDNGASWRASANIGGSPGADDPPVTIPPVVINEVLTASDPPETDTIELLNPTGGMVQIGGWFLTDDANAPMKYRIPDGTSIEPGGFVVFDESDFNQSPGDGRSFSLNSHGDEVYLFSGDAQTNLTGYSHGVRLGGAARGISFGRYVNSAGAEDFPAQSATSFDAANVGPLLGSVLINEVHYNAPRGESEFVELYNHTAAPVPLYDISNPSNTWKLNGLGFDFPTNITLPPGGYLLLVASDPDIFRSRHSVPLNVLVLGPYDGGLQDSGERLELSRPGPPDTNGVPYQSVDAVRYNDRAPWPAAPDGAGASLQRIRTPAYGNEPLHWFAGPPSPGRQNSPDTDADGIPDQWETDYGTNPLESDADVDLDKDGLSNFQEFLAGTNPQDAASNLVLGSAIEGNALTMWFQAMANHTYSVLAAGELQDGPWSKVFDVPAASTNRTISILEGALRQQRFFRLVTPQTP